MDDGVIFFLDIMKQNTETDGEPDSVIAIAELGARLITAEPLTNNVLPSELAAIPDERWRELMPLPVAETVEVELVEAGDAIT